MDHILNGATNAYFTDQCQQCALLYFCELLDNEIVLWAKLFFGHFFEDVHTWGKLPAGMNTGGRVKKQQVKASRKLLYRTPLQKPF